jgi:hypothetical protein
MSKIIIPVDQFNQMLTSGLEPWQNDFQLEDCTTAEAITTAKGNTAVQVEGHKISMNTLVQTFKNEDSIFAPVEEGTGKAKKVTGYEFSIEGFSNLALLARKEGKLVYSMS